MKRILRITLLLLLIGGFQRSFAQRTPVDQNGSLRVCGTQLCNQHGQPVQLRGMSTHGIQWYGWGDCLTESSLDALAYDWGADVLRISLYVQEGGYETDPVGFTNQVSRLIDEATDRGLYALVDWHQLSPGDPTANLDNAKRFFTDIVQLHKDQNNVIYDVCNEPNGNGTTWNRIKTYADQIIPVIRAINNDAVVLVGTHGWSTFGGSGQGDLRDVIDNPLRFDNVMYTFHFYANDHRDRYLRILDQASDALPVFVTEFGTQTASGDGANDFAMSQQYIDLMRRKKISWTNWNYSDDFRSGAVWESGTCSREAWQTENLKPAGQWIRERIQVPEDDFPTGGNPDPDPDGQAPYEGIPWAVPGKIEAEQYDRGGEGVAYRDLSPSNEGGAYRNEAVDIEPCTDEGGGFNVGWLRTGEWIEYTLNVDLTGEYPLDVRVAAIASGRVFHVEVDGQNATGSLTVPNTQGWQNWQTVSTSVTLQAGAHVLRVVADSDDFNINFLEFAGSSRAARTSDGSLSSELRADAYVYPNPTEDQFDVAKLGETSGQLEILTPQGQRVMYVPDYTAGPITVSALKSGLYLVRIVAGNTTRTMPLLKK